MIAEGLGWLRVFGGGVRIIKIIGIPHFVRDFRRKTKMGVLIEHPS
jgi:hypothetical protein